MIEPKPTIFAEKCQPAPWWKYNCMHCNMALAFYVKPNGEECRCTNCGQEYFIQESP